MNGTMSKTASERIGRHPWAIGFGIPLLAFLLVLSSAPPASAGPDPAAAVAALQEQLTEEFTSQEALIDRLGRRDLPLPAPLPPIFDLFQHGRFNQRGVYMSEAKNLRLMADEARAFLASPGAKAAQATLADLVVTLYRTSAKPWHARFNGYLFLDFLYNSGEFDRLPRSDADRLMDLRRALSRADAADGYRYQLSQGYEPVSTAKPPAYLSDLLERIAKLPGETGDAIRYTLHLTGLESLTSSIFTDYAIERLRDWRTRRAITALHARLERRLAEAKAGREGEDLWSIALSVAQSRDQAMELLGVFCTQHRTLAKSILPRIKSNEERIGLYEPLLACADNFFLIQQINELSRDAEGRYTFAYPRGFHDRNRRFYHFWSEGFIGWKLAQEGFSNEAIRFVTTHLGVAYETWTLPINLRVAVVTRCNTLESLTGWFKDIHEHRRGVRYALLLRDAERQAR